jgi:hypothetical protein
MGVRFLKSIVDQHLWIALSALSLSAVSYFDYGLEPKKAILLFAFGSCLCAYNYLNIQPRLHSVEKNQLTWPVIMISCGLMMMAYSFYVCGIALILLAAIPSAIVFLYILPLIPARNIKAGYRTELIPGRNNAWFKISLIALAWTVSTYAIPILLDNPSPELNPFITGFLQRFFYVFGLTIPFDARDISIDPAEMRTFAQRHGLKSSISFATLVLGISAAIAAYSTTTGHLSENSLYIHLITILTSIILILFINGKSRYYFTFIIDGIMILPLLLYQIIK